MNANPKPCLLCIGYGYTASYLSAELGESFRIRGTCRSKAKQQALMDTGVEAYIAALPDTAPDATMLLQDVTHVLITLPPNVQGDAVYEQYGDALLRSGIKWLGYLSTTGVYGDTQGEWVDETAQPKPDTGRAENRLKAERQWLQLAEQGLPVHIFRLPGIYGPGRNVLEDLQEGIAKCIIKPGQVFSRVHVEDIAGVLHASIRRPQAGEIYNVCDDKPAPSHEVVEYGAKLLQMEPPPAQDYASANLSPMAASFYLSNRRVKNNKIKEMLGYSLRYPTYREGLASILHKLKSHNSL